MSLTIKIAGHTFKMQHNTTINLKYDSVASSFSTNIYFDPYNSVHKQIFRPLNYPVCQIYYRGVLILTGIVLSHKFHNAGDPPKTLVAISGYSKTGVLEDCPCVETPLQTNNLSFREITERMCKHYGLKVIVDEEVAEVCETIIPTSNPEPDEKTARYLDKLASHLNVVLSHDRYGNVVLTKVKSDRILTTSETLVNSDPVPLSNDIEGAPIATNYKQTKGSKDRAVLFDFTKPTEWTNMELNVDGQQIHSDIVVVSQATEATDPNAIESNVLTNPYVSNSTAQETVFDEAAADVPDRGPRPETIVQTRHTEEFDNAAPKTARGVMGDELKSINLRLSVPRWVLNGHVITPNQMLTVKNPEVYLYNKTKMFIQEVVLYCNEVDEEAKITCVPPESFGTDDINPIF